MTSGEVVVKVLVGPDTGRLGTVVRFTSKPGFVRVRMHDGPERTIRANYLVQGFVPIPDPKDPSFPSQIRRTPPGTQAVEL